jgi:hypothetical protein
MPASEASTWRHHGDAKETVSARQHSSDHTRQSCTACATAARLPTLQQGVTPVLTPADADARTLNKSKGLAQPEGPTPLRLRERDASRMGEVRNAACLATCIVHHGEAARCPQAESAAHARCRQGSRTARKPIMRCACSDGHAAERPYVRRSKLSTKKLPPRSTRYAPVSGPFGFSRGDEA